MLLTLSLLSFPQDGIQPLLLVLYIFGHADEPLVFSRVVDLPAVCHCVVVAVIVRCKAKNVLIFKMGEKTFKDVDIEKGDISFLALVFLSPPLPLMLS